MKSEEQGHEPQPSSGLSRMVAVSAALHVAVIVFLLVATSHQNSESSPRLLTHTVELVSPGVLGPVGEGRGETNSTPAARSPREQKSPPPLESDHKDPPVVSRPTEAAQEEPEKVQAKKPPPPKPPQARKAVEPPKPKEPPAPKAKETPQVVAAKSPRQEPPAVKPKPVEPPKPKEVMKLPEKIKKPEPKQPEKPEKKPEPEKVVKKTEKPEKKSESEKVAKKLEKPEKELEPEKVVKKTEKSPTEKEQAQAKNSPVEKSPPEKKTKITTGKSESPSATNAKEQKSEERENGEAREREQRVLAAVERIRANEETAQREAEIATALERVRKGVTEKADGKGDGGGPSREAPGSIRQEKEAASHAAEGGGGGHGAEFMAYTQHIKQKVKEAWILAERKPGLRAVVRFRVEPNGEVVGAEVADSSGDQTFDQSALRAVRKAGPFPEPPEAHREEFATQKVEITFSGEERIR
ncbi:MAG: cell envelope integrity protein TolA [Deltaproteobacteria bacterium]|nr:cell envelope integrity protein TolA [Deltaproteobacteria bacterium]